MLVICARLGSKGKVGVQRGRKTAGCPSFLPTAVGTASSPPRGAARSRRPQTANPPLRFSGKLSAPSGRTRLRQFEHPGQPVQRKEPPVRANTLTQFVCPARPVLKKEPPVRANPLTQFAHLARPVLKKLPPGQGEPPARFRCPNRHGAEKRVPHTDICPPVKTKYFYALHYKSDVL